MSSSLQARHGPPSAQRRKDRRRSRQPAFALRLWRALTSVFRRPIGLSRTAGRWRLGFLDRRKAPADALATVEMCTDLSVRLLAFPADRSAKMLRHLAQVSDELGIGGWAAVQALPPVVLHRALIQAQWLAHDGPTLVLQAFIDKLRQCQRESGPAYGAAARAAVEPELEVSEASAEEFEASRRSWFATLSPPESPDAPNASARPR